MHDGPLLALWQLARLHPLPIGVDLASGGRSARGRIPRARRAHPPSLAQTAPTPSHLCDGRDVCKRAPKRGAWIIRRDHLKIPEMDFALWRFSLLREGPAEDQIPAVPLAPLPREVNAGRRFRLRFLNNKRRRCMAGRVRRRCTGRGTRGGCGPALPPIPLRPEGRRSEPRPWAAMGRRAWWRDRCSGRGTCRRKRRGLQSEDVVQDDWNWKTGIRHSAGRGAGTETGLR